MLIGILALIIFLLKISQSERLKKHSDEYNEIVRSYKNQIKHE